MEEIYKMMQAYEAQTRLVILLLGETGVRVLGSWAVRRYERKFQRGGYYIKISINSHRSHSESKLKSLHMVKPHEAKLRR